MIDEPYFLRLINQEKFITTFPFGKNGEVFGLNNVEFPSFPDAGVPLVDHRTSRRSLRFSPLSRKLDGATLWVDDESRPTAKARSHEQDRFMRLDLTLHGKTRRGCEYFSVWSAGTLNGKLEPTPRGDGGRLGRRRGSWIKLVTNCTLASR